MLYRRSFELRASPLILLPNSPPRLHSLKFVSRFKDPGRGSFRNVAKFTGLTELKLACDNINWPSADFSTLQSLAVQHLSLLCCTGLEPVLLQPGAFAALTKLHISQSYREEDEFYSSTSTPEAEREERLVQLHQACKTILSHPCLTEISGRSKLLALVRAHEQNGFSRVFALDCNYSLKCSCRECLRTVVWVKDSSISN